MPKQRQLRFIELLRKSNQQNEADALVLREVARILVSSRELADFFEEICTQIAPTVHPSAVANFIMTEMLREYNPEQFSDCKVSPEQLATLLLMVQKGKISLKIAKTVFTEMLASGTDPEQIVKEKGLVQMSDEGELLAAVQAVVAANPEQVQQYREGKTKVMGFLVGQLMKQTKGKANPQLANKLLLEALGPVS